MFFSKVYFFQAYFLNFRVKNALKATILSQQFDWITWQFDFAVEMSNPEIFQKRTFCTTLLWHWYHMSHRWQLYVPKTGSLTQFLWEDFSLAAVRIQDRLPDPIPMGRRLTTRSWTLQFYKKQDLFFSQRIPSQTITMYFDCSLNHCNCMLRVLIKTLYRF